MGRKRGRPKTSNQLALLCENTEAGVRTMEKDPTINKFSPSLVVRPEVYDKVIYWVKNSDLEVSGMGKVIYHPKSHVFEVVEAYLLDQEVGAAHTDIDAEALGKLMFESKDVPGNLAWWWHSHVNMQAFWSGTDTQTIRTFGQQGWCTATVFNKKEESKTAVCYKVTNPIFGSESILLESIPAQVLKRPDARHESWEAELKAKVRKPPVVTPYWEGGKTWEASTTYVSPRHTPTINPLEKTHLTRGVHTVKDSTALDEWGLTPEERAEVYREGISGMGLHTDARFLNLTPAELYEKMQTCGREVYNKMEEDLMVALYSGELR